MATAHEVRDAVRRSGLTIYADLTELPTPNSEEPAEFAAPGLRHCDVRYALFFGTLAGDEVEIKSLVLSTGEAFFSEFRRFGGLVQNKKLQIPIPSSLFV